MRSVGGMTFPLCPKEIKAGVGQYPVRINSVTDSVRSTSMWRWYGANKGLPPFCYTSDRILTASKFRQRIKQTQIYCKKGYLCAIWRGLQKPSIRTENEYVMDKNTLFKAFFGCRKHFSYTCLRLFIHRIYT